MRLFSTLSPYIFIVMAIVHFSFASTNLKQNENSILIHTSIQYCTTNMNNGSITVNINGGQAPYKVMVISTTQPILHFNTSNFKLENLSEGTYKIIVEDSKNQRIQKDVELTSQK
jgi:hypothetical protein